MGILSMAATAAEGTKGDGLRKIMVVDDEVDITSVLKMGLQKKGFDIDAFNDPLDALAAFVPGRYDLVLSDVRMPKMNGLELAYEIKKRDPYQKIVFLTAYMDLFSELKKLFQRMDVLDVIQKPVGITELVDRLVSLDEKSRSKPNVAHP